MKKIKNNLLSLRIILKELEYKHVFAWITLIFFVAILTPCITWLYKLLIDYFSHENTSPVNIILLVVIYVIAQFLQESIENLQSNFAVKLNYRLNNRINYVINKKLSVIRAELYEDKAVFDLISRVRENITFETINTFGNVLALFMMIITTISYIGIISTINCYLPIIITCSLVPYCILFFFQQRKKYEQNVELSDKRRYVNYLNSVLTERENAKDIRTFESLDYIKGKVQKEREKVYIVEKRLAIKQLRENILVNIFQYGIIGTTLFWGYCKYRDGNITLGDIMLIITALQGIISSFSSIADNFMSMSDFSFNLKDWKTFIDLEEEPLINIDLKSFDLQLENVSFVYPGSEKKVLNNINLHIKEGEKVAIVGENGSGKTTLLYLLLGIYEPTTGVVKIGKENLQNVLRDYRKKVSCLFQDYIKYQMSIEDNVFLNRQISKKYINKFVEKNDFIKNFPEMEKTMLGKINDLGIELSGGQWQKLAISRALVKPETKILIMDEPVASLDPKSENDLYINFDDICQKKSLILISHRLGVTRLCDKIIVMKEGRIIEQGSHNQLMAVKGEYYKMFTAQQQFYK
ncbi:MAG: ABC transporter ATP-binding protein [Ruminococcus sp.]|nr:ABC transporter ATP-binding protein [Ruminococcus sp.]